MGAGLAGVSFGSGRDSAFSSSFGFAGVGFAVEVFVLESPFSVVMTTSPEDESVSVPLVSHLFAVPSEK